MIIKFEYERSTTNTHRFMEVPRPGEEKIIGPLYIQKWYLGEEPPIDIVIDLQTDDKLADEPWKPGGFGESATVEE